MQHLGCPTRPGGTTALDGGIETHPSFRATPHQWGLRGLRATSTYSSRRRASSPRDSLQLLHGDQAFPRHDALGPYHGVELLTALELATHFSGAELSLLSRCRRCLSLLRAASSLPRCAHPVADGTPSGGWGGWDVLGKRMGGWDVLMADGADGRMWRMGRPDASRR